MLTEEHPCVQLMQDKLIQHKRTIFTLYVDTMMLVQSLQEKGFTVFSEGDLFGAKEFEKTLDQKQLLQSLNTSVLFVLHAHPLLIEAQEIVAPTAKEFDAAMNKVREEELRKIDQERRKPKRTIVLHKSSIEPLSQASNIPTAPQVKEELVVTEKQTTPAVGVELNEAEKQSVVSEEERKNSIDDDPSNQKASIALIVPEDAEQDVEVNSVLEEADIVFSVYKSTTKRAKNICAVSRIPTNDMVQPNTWWEGSKLHKVMGKISRGERVKQRLFMSALDAFVDVKGQGGSRVKVKPNQPQNAKDKLDIHTMHGGDDLVDAANWRYRKVKSWLENRGLSIACDDEETTEGIVE